MAGESEGRSRGAFVALLVGAVGIVAAAAALYWTSGFGLWARSDAGAPSGAAGLQIGQGAEKDPVAAWRTVQPSDVLLVKAEEVLELQGKMKVGTDLDNERGLAADGNRAAVHFVWVEDKACEEGEDPAQHRAVFELRVDKAGTYYPWARVWWTDSCGDSIVVLIQHEGDAAPTRWEITDGTHEWWHWLRLAGSDGVELKEGSYTVTVENREDGARLSRILFSERSYKAYMPSAPEG